ncbi:MAG: DNA cytosine methyltransferase [Comamonas sp.]
MQRKKIPVIDLFAGPGGLGEGFSSIFDEDGSRRFDVTVSIEKEEIAHRTLSLRALFRSFPKEHVPDCYYDYLRGSITREELFNHPDIPEESRLAAQEAKCAELGVTPHQEIDGWIRNALDGVKEWVLIGGPPCQAYSLAGRSRMRPSDSEKFEKDKRHFLYTEYLRIIKEFGPAVFVMENVKGILSSKHGGSPIFDRIINDLRDPGNGFKYQVRSFVVGSEEPSPMDYLIQSEKFGLPQARHRVILFGIRSDLAKSAWRLLGEPSKFLLKEAGRTVGVCDALAGLPALRSRLSREPDSREAWLSVVKNASKGLKDWCAPLREKIEDEMAKALCKSQAISSFGARFIKQSVPLGVDMPKNLRDWVGDPRLGGVIQHEARSHMRSDLDRYMFASCFAKVQGYSPTLPLFPPRLLPAHGNMAAEQIPFIDRFRVQVGNQPATTVVSHIAKDGHYYIHYDPAQCRSLTVREAARIQTFPDNYLFEGNRTQQYWQVGNAVPPFLARQIAEVVVDFLDSSKC